MATGKKFEDLRVTTNINGLIGAAESEPADPLGGYKFEFSSDETLADNSDAIIPTQKAIKSYVDNNIPDPQLTADELAAVQGASNPSATNAFATIADLPSPLVISTDIPNMDGTGSAGSTGEVSDGGHTHPSDTSKANDNAVFHKAIAGEFATLTEKLAPIGTDIIILENSEDGLKKVFAKVSTLPFQDTRLDSTSVISRGNGISLGDVPSNAFSTAQIVNANVEIGDTVTIGTPTPTVFTVAATGSGLNFVKGETATDTINNLIAAVAGAGIPISSSLISTDYVKFADTLGGTAGNSYTLVTSKPTAFVISNTNFIGGGYKTLNFDECVVVASDGINTKKHILPAESNVAIYNGSYGFTYFTVNFDDNLNIIPFEISPGIFSNYTQSYTNPNDNPSSTSGYRKNATVGLATHTLIQFGGGISTYSEFGSGVPRQLGASIVDDYYAEEQGGTNLGDIIANGTDTKLKSLGGILYRPEINPRNSIPFKCDISSKLLDNVVFVYRIGGSSPTQWVKSIRYQSGGIQFANNYYDNNTSPNPVVPINTVPNGVVGTNLWSGRFFYIDPTSNSVQCLIGQSTYTGSSAPSLSQAILEFNGLDPSHPLVKPDFLLPRYLFAIVYLKSGGSNYSLISDMVHYNFLSLKNGGISSSASYLPRDQINTLYFSSDGSDSNSGLNPDAPMTLSGAANKASSLGYTNAVLRCEESVTFSGTLTLQGTISIDAPNASLALTTFNLTGSGGVVIIRSRAFSTTTFNSNNTGTATLQMYVKSSIAFSTINFNGTGICTINLLTYYQLTGSWTVNATTTGNGIRLYKDLGFAAITWNDATPRSSGLLFNSAYSSGALNLTNINVSGTIQDVAGVVNITNCALKLIIDVLRANINAINCTGSLVILDYVSGTLPQASAAFSVALAQHPTDDISRYVNGGAARWFLIASQTSDSTFAVNEFQFDVLSATLGSSQIYFKTLFSAGNPTPLLVDYQIHGGDNEALRPNVRMYYDTDTTLHHIYIQLPANTTSTILNKNLNLNRKGFESKFADSGTGVDPLSIPISYENVYYTADDEKGYIVSKNVTWTSAVIASGASSICITKLPGKGAIIFFRELSTVGVAGTPSALTLLPDSIPTQYLPAQAIAEHKIVVYEEALAYTVGTITINPDGSAKLNKNLTDTFAPAVGAAVGFKAFSIFVSSI